MGIMVLFIYDSIIALTMVIAAAFITWYIVQLKGKSRATWWFAAFFAGITLVTIALFLESSLLVWGKQFFALRVLAAIGAQASLIQFAYHLPTSDQPRESRVLLIVSCAAILVAGGACAHFISRTLADPQGVPAGSSTLLTVMLPLGLLAVVGVLLRRMVHHHRTARGTGRPPRRPFPFFPLLALLTFFTDAARALVRPAGRDAAALRAFIGVFLVGFIPTASPILLRLNLISAPVSAYLVSLGILLVLLSLFLVFLNQARETSSFIARIFSISLVLLLALFGVMALLMTSARNEQFRQKRLWQIAAVEQALFRDDLTQAQMPAEVAYIAAIASQPPPDEAGAAAATRYRQLYPTKEPAGDPDQPGPLPFLAAEDRARREAAVPLEDSGSRPLKYLADLTTLPGIPRVLRYAGSPLGTIPRYVGYQVADAANRYEIGFRLSDDLRYLNRENRRLMVLLLVSSVVLWLALPLFFRLNLVQPLHALLEGTRQANAGNLDIALPVQYEDEIGFLTRSFNAMIGSVKAAHDALRQANARLEERVQQRTAELQRAREEADAARGRADAANQAKSVFLANMSHELRTPLNAILGFAQLMTRSKSLPPEHRENLGIISRSGEHLLTLINNVLDLSKIEAGRTTLHEKTVDLHRFLDDLDDMFHLRATDKHLQLCVERTPEVPRYVCTDELKLRQVLINLLNNAIKFTEEGGVALRVRVQGPGAEGAEEEATPDARTLLFEVEDTGPGIAPDERDRLFEAFTQTTSGQQSQEGTGLGLPISRQFVRLMGGEMHVRSEVGRGSVFSFTTRVTLVEASAIEAPRSRRQIVALEPGQPRYRILVVDDRADNRSLLVKLLQPPGFDLREARNGQEALDTCEQWEPHLIWMDMRMPIMDGYEATRRIKALTSAQAPTIIALTASSFEEERATVLAAGCDDFLRKPFREADIFAMMHKHLGVRYVYETPEEQTEAPPSPVVPPSSSHHTLLVAALADLPAHLVTALQQAATRADIVRVSSLIEQIRPFHAHLAERLERLANDFEYDQILDLIEHDESTR